MRVGSDVIWWDEEYLADGRAVRVERAAKVTRVYPDMPDILDLVVFLPMAGGNPAAVRHASKCQKYDRKGDDPLRGCWSIPLD